jgi:hypothetical protein
MRTYARVYMWGLNKIDDAYVDVDNCNDIAIDIEAMPVHVISTTDAGQSHICIARGLTILWWKKWQC